MGDLAALADTNCVNGQGDKEISHKNYIENREEQRYGDMWGLALSPNGVISKNPSGDDSNTQETTDRGQKKSIKKSSILREFSPILSPLLPQVKEKQQPTETITFSEASVRQLVSETECDRKGSISPEKPRKEPRSNEDNKTSANVKQKTSPNEASKRRKAKNDEEKKTSKQMKEETNRLAKGACPQCGMANADGLRTICKSCINLRKETKSKEAVNLKKKRIKPTTVTDSQTNSETGDSEQNDEAIYTEEEGQNKSRRMSLDFNEIAETLTLPDKKYCPPKRTSTDLGQGSKANIYTESPNPEQASDKVNNLNNRLEDGNQRLGDNVGDFTLAHKRDDKQSSMNVDTKHRLMKRSTTDSEIVSKVKINANIGKVNDRKGSADSKAINGNKKLDSARTMGGKREHSNTSVKSDSPDYHKEHSTVNYKLERSKTILGKVNFDSEKKPSAEGTEGIKTKELSSNSLDNDRSDAKSKKFNSARSHTIIGDGLAKRQKQKSDTAKTKSGKREGSSNSVKKKSEFKHSGDAEEERKVSFVEEDSTKKKAQEDEQRQMFCNIIPKNLYDCCHEDDSSESEDESDATTVEESSIAEERDLEPIPMEPTILQSSGNQQQKQATNATQPQTPYADRNMRWLKMENDYGIVPEELSLKYRSYEPDRSHYGVQNQIDDGMGFHSSYAMDSESYAMDDDDNDSEFNEDSRVSRTTVSRSYGDHNNEQIYNTLEKIEEEGEDSEDEDDVYRPSNESWYCTKNANIISGVCNSDRSDKDIVKTDSYSERNSSFDRERNSSFDRERNSSFDREANHEEIELSYSDYHPYTISRYGEGVDELDGYTSLNGKEKMVDYRETSNDGTIAQRTFSDAVNDRDYFGYETDVDTGMAVTSNKPEDSKNFMTRNEWGFLNTGDDSSSSSDDSDNDDGEDAWYTGGIYAGKSKSNTSENNDDLVYFNDKAGAQLSDSDIYTGELFSNLDSKVNEIKDISKNNNISLEENILARRKIWYNISSRPQMHPATTERVIITGINTVTGDGDSLFCNLSNNGIYDDEGDDIPHETRKDERKIKQMVLTKSDYTEYANVVHQVKPKKDLILFGKSDFSKYDMPMYEGKQRDEDGFMRRGDSDKVELVFFGENKQKQVNKPFITTNCEQNLYFNTKLPENVNYEPNYDREQERKLDRDDSYQGGFFYATRYGYNNNNGNGPESSSEHYTGCFRNEEEYKPTHEGLFNDKPTSFNFQKRRPGIDTLYFNSSNSKSYYDVEDSIYAFEQKERAIKKKPVKPPIVKVGGITVRNNVECEVDYAQNINMDLQMTTWKRYDAVGEEEAPEAEGSDYAKNILFEEMVGGKPWVMDDCRAPWKVTKTQNTVVGKNKADNKWKAPDKMVKSVKSLGTYVTKWF